LFLNNRVRGEPAITYFLLLLNNCSAGQPISLCLQNLQAKELRTKPFPAEVSITNKTIRIKINQLKLNINNTIPTTTGIIETKKSGRISFQLILRLRNAFGFPFLKNNELILPFPKAQYFP
jgi:hypothetical protein